MAIVSNSKRVLAMVAILGVSYFGLTILLLSLLTTDYNPVSQLASDYGVGRFAIEMNLGFLIGGIGLIAFALSIGRISRAGSALLLIDGLVLIMDSYFTTNIEGAPATSHGTIHGFGGAIFFFTAPVGILLVSYRLGRSRFLITLVAFIIGVMFEIANSALSLNAGGLAERVILLVIFSSVIAASPSLSKTAYDT
jgi:Protein of unknown function (DUF998)